MKPIVIMVVICTECFFLINAITFTLLYLAMQRFSIYCIPFVTLALFFGIKHRNAEMGRWTYLPWRGRLPFAVTKSLERGCQHDP